MPDKESFDRTVATLILFAVWSVIVIAPMFFPRAEPAPDWLMLGTTAIVWLVIGRQWGLEVERVLNAVTNIRVTTDGGQPRDDDRED
ncbi:hypothetical protein [Natronolimnobius baerhuensis]|nr:hypothetical protein [Natronolimnobius baerhuensis]